MSGTLSTDSLGPRLVVQRLVAPGMLDRRALQRTQERLSHPASAHVLDRLHRRIGLASPDGGSLLLARVDRSADPDMVAHAERAAAPLAADGGMASRVGSGSGPGAATPATTGVGRTISTVGLVARPNVPAITRAGQVIARRVAVVPSLGGTPRVAARLTSRTDPGLAAALGTPPSGTGSAAPPILVQRITDHGGDIRGAPASSIAAAPTATSASGQEGQGSVLASSSLPISTTRDALRADAFRRVGNTSAGPRATANPSRGFTPILMRKASAPAPSAGSSGLLTVGAQPMVVSTAPTPLVLRKHAAAVRTDPSHPTRSAIGPSPTDAIVPEAAPAAATEGAWRSADLSTIDWIAEQVAHRLARRLEIERERMGVRSWRQVS
jgi:hypothetical protein